MKKKTLCAVALALGLLLCLAGGAQANLLLTFDDVVAGYPLPQARALPSDYGGFNWFGTGGYWGLIGNADYRNIYQNNFNFPTNPNAVTNESPDQMGAPVVTITSSSPFTFDGAYFSSWTGFGGSYYGAGNLTIIGKLGETVVGETTIALQAGPLSWYDINFVNVDSLTFLAAVGSNGGRYFLMDNFADANSVPIPGSLLLLFSGLAGLGFLRLRSSRDSA